MAKTSLPYFTGVPLANALSHLLASRRTFFGAVPPWLTRLLTEWSIESTENTSLVMRLSIA